MTFPTSTFRPTRRNWFLVLVITIVSAWLFAFGLDGLLSVSDDLIKALTGSDSLDLTRNVVALTVLALAPVVMLLLIITPPIPKRVFMPAVICAIWVNLIIWPLHPGTGPMASTHIAAVQLVIFALTLFFIHRRTGRFSLVATDLPMRKRIALRVAAGLSTTFITIVICIVVMFSSSTARMIEKGTGGYLRISRHGVEVADKTFTKGDKSVRLVGMVHIGDAHFYEDLFKSFPDNALVLTEGVTDKDHKLSEKFGYGNVASALGLSEQGRLQAGWMKDEAKKEAAAGQMKKPAPATVANADIDISEFKTLTIAFLNDIARVYSAPSKWKAFDEITAMNGRYTSQQVTDIYADIIDTRNAHVITTMDDALKSRDALVIPWGAEHMPGIEKSLKDRGYKIATEKYRMVISFF